MSDAQTVELRVKSDAFGQPVSVSARCLLCNALLARQFADHLYYRHLIPYELGYQIVKETDRMEPTAHVRVVDI